MPFVYHGAFLLLARQRLQQLSRLHRIKVAILDVVNFGINFVKDRDWRLPALALCHFGILKGGL